MLTESELVALMEDQQVIDAMHLLKKDFTDAEAKFTDLSDDDFIALVLLAPSVGVALANGSISLFEELSLNKKARSLSRKSYFLKRDPLAHALKYLIQNFDKWEDRFYELIRLTMFATLGKNKVFWEAFQHPNSAEGDLATDLLNAPYIFVKLVTFLFLEEENDTITRRSISQIEYDKIVEIGKRLELGHVPVFGSFLEGFDVR
ncbi:MAG: hypothetical protein ACFCUI_05010 [Bernardetiaceae bacterium]